MNTPRIELIPGFRNPHLLADGTGKAVPSIATPSQTLKVTRPIVGIRIAADSQVDMLDLFPAGKIGEPVNRRERIRVSAESPWVGRITRDEMAEMIAVPVRAFMAATVATVVYPEQQNEIGGAAGGADNGYPYVKLEIFECDCEGKCGGHPPPWPQKLAPLLLIERREDVGPWSFRIPTAGRELVSISFAFDSFAGGTTGVSYDIDGIDYSVRRESGQVEDMVDDLSAAANQPADDYFFVYEGPAYDEIRLALTVVGGGSAQVWVRMEVK